jgi:hypothetical protein
MKRVVNGVTYNTETSEKIGRIEWTQGTQDEEQYEATLYRTRGGAFFVVEVKRWHEYDGDTWQPHEKTTFEPMTSAEAHKWIMDGDQVEIFHNPFDDPPEAEGDAGHGATVYVRVSESLKDRIDAAARAVNVSINTWALRCFEEVLRQAEETEKRRGEAIQAELRKEFESNGLEIGIYNYRQQSSDRETTDDDIAKHLREEFEESLPDLVDERLHPRQ